MIMNTLFRRSVENPAVPLSQIAQGDGIFEALTGGTASSGVSVTPKTGLTDSALWRAVTKLAGDIARMPLPLYRKTNADGTEREKDIRHPAYRLMRRAPSELYTAYTFKQTMAMHMLWSGRGNGYAYIDRKNNGDPVALYILNPLQTEPIRVAGQLWYYHVFADGSDTKFAPEDILHWHGPGFDGLQGYDIVEYMAEVLGYSIGARTYGSIFLKNHAIPGIVIQRPREAKALSKEAERHVVDAVDKVTTGLDKAHKTILIQEGMDLKTIGLDARKAQLNEARKFSIIEVANFFGLPVHLLGNTDPTSYASLEQMNRQYLDAVDPWLIHIEEECDRKLLSTQEYESESNYFEFTREQLVAIDHDTLTRTLIDQVNNGLLSADEARAIRNRPPLPNGIGRVFRIPANIQLMGEDGGVIQTGQPDQPSAGDGQQDQGTNADPSDGDQNRAALASFAADAAGRLVKRIGIQAIKAGTDKAALHKWAAGPMFRANVSAIRSGLAPVCRTASDSAELIDEACRQIDRIIVDELRAIPELPGKPISGGIQRWIEPARVRVGRAFADWLLEQETSNARA